MKIIVSVFLIFLSLVAYANDYTPLVREGVKWHCRMDVVSLITETESYPYTIEIKGDTIINDVSYKKCYYTFEDESVATNEIPRAFLREDIGEKKVYAFYNYDYKMTLPHYSLYGDFEPFTEGLLYDFNNLANANQGWYAFVNNGEEDTITTEVIELNSKEYVETTLNKYFVFIEGIGIAENKYFEHEGDLLNPAMPRIASAFSPEALPIFCSFEDETGTVIYTSEYSGVENPIKDGNNISIEISNNNINIIANQSLISVKIINMAGMVVIDDVTSKENTITILTDKYHSGCYIIQVSTENNIATKKIIL